MRRILTLLVFATTFLTAAAVAADKPFAIVVTDAQDGRGVPLVELRTVNDIRYYTDSNGVVAFHEPGLVGQRVYFHVKSHGYEFPKDGFGYRGQALDVTSGGSASLNIKRLNIAQRLYRVTGGGIYRESLLAHRFVNLRQPVLNAQVFGSDSVVNAVYHGKVYWFWGDTNRPAYPLGNFHVPGATSLLPSAGGLNPNFGVDLTYFVDDRGFAKPTAQMPGEGPTWINGLVVLSDKVGRERMFAAYVKVKGFLQVYEHGLVEFNDTKTEFEKVTTFPEGAPVYPGGHPFRRTSNGVEHVFFANPYPLTRVRAEPERLSQLREYEAFTCLQPGSRPNDLRLDRDAAGQLRYGWKKDAPPLGPEEQAKLLRAGKLKPEEALLHLQDPDTGKPVRAHGGSVYWNSHRGRWVMITVEAGGTSQLGEVWYAEADTPLGPWVYARKVVTHERYSFYNPKQHPFFDKDGGRQIYFEGTYTHTFSGNPEPTPRYDYNQIMYKLDLTDPRLAMPVALYELDENGRLGTGRDLKPGQPRRPVFFAQDRPTTGTVPIPGTPPLFHGLPASMKGPPATAVPLHEFVHTDGKQRMYSVDASWSRPDYVRAKQPVCLVWRNPMQVALPGE